VDLAVGCVQSLVLGPMSALHTLMSQLNLEVCMLSRLVLAYVCSAA
jgi:hypothetical protein